MGLGVREYRRTRSDTGVRATSFGFGLEDSGGMDEFFGEDAFLS